MRGPRASRSGAGIRKVRPLTSGSTRRKLDLELCYRRVRARVGDRGMPLLRGGSRA